MPKDKHGREMKKMMGSKPKKKGKKGKPKSRKY